MFCKYRFKKSFILNEDKIIWIQANAFLYNDSITIWFYVACPIIFQQNLVIFMRKSILY